MNRYALYARKSQEDEGRQQQSIDDQVRLMTALAERQGLTLVATLTEEKSAKEPYARPVFDALIAKVQAGEVEGVLCYHVNRLARNMVEGGLLQHLLTKGVLKEIRTHTEVFRSGDNILPFILQAAMSTQYSLDLSQHVRRGIASKVEKGGYPQRAPEGYVNNLFEHTIEKDARRFVLIRQAWDLMRTGTYSLERLALVMNEEWGYTTRKARKIRGRGISKSGLHRLLGNVFYTGYFLHKGELVKGNHPAMVSFEEFDQVQKVLRRQGPTRPQRREFAYTGLVVCGSCGRQVTAEHKRGRHQKGDYTYYHCSNWRVCGEKAVRQEVLEEEIARRLRSVAVHPTFRALCIEVIERTYREESEKEQAEMAQQHRALEEAERRMSRLIQMGLKEMLSDAEFAREKARLQNEINGLKMAAVRAQNQLEEARDGAIEVVRFVTSAPYEFLRGSPLARKRQIARTLGITYRLTGGHIETTLHPLLAPLLFCAGEEAAGSGNAAVTAGGVAGRAIEPRESGSDNKKDGSAEPSVPLGWAGGTMVEPLLQVWNLLRAGAARLPAVTP